MVEADHHFEQHVAGGDLLPGGDGEHRRELLLLHDLLSARPGARRTDTAMIPPVRLSFPI
jgi:hypothetical protein